MEFELMAFIESSNLKDSKKAPIRCKYHKIWHNPKQRDLITTCNGCSQLVLKTQCRTCRGQCSVLDTEIGDNNLIDCPECTGGHILLIVQDKPCGKCDNGIVMAQFDSDYENCHHCQGFGGVSVGRILEAMKVNYPKELDNFLHGISIEFEFEWDAPNVLKCIEYIEAQSYLTYCEGIITKTE